MHNYNHKKLIEKIAGLDSIPLIDDDFSEWITAKEHLKFLCENTNSDELIIFANSEYTYIDTIVVPNKVLSKASTLDIDRWKFRSYDPIASFVSGGGKDGVWLERGVNLSHQSKQIGTQLVFNRTFDGFEGKGRSYVEINQEFTHVTGVHWRPEKKAYCRYDDHGDMEATVSITTREDKDSGMTLVTFKRAPLEEYLTAVDASLLMRFDFTLLRRESFIGWPKQPPTLFSESKDFFYHQLVMPGYAAYTAGRQIIKPRRSKDVIAASIVDGWFGNKDKRYVDFIAYDWRNQCIRTISTSPDASTNYFEATENNLPFELSPAFFRPEVLSKYKTDREKYTISEREITCRTAWHLKGIDVNKAGQVHAYICDLRALPYEEQLHWLGYNENPKETISKRAYINDFEGDFVDFSEPHAQVISLIRRWHEKKTSWWSLRDEKLIDRINVPITSSKDEWGEAFMDLAKLVVEGFNTAPVRAKLNDEKIDFVKDDRTIALLEKLINKDTANIGVEKKLSGLRTVQHLRSKVKGHVGGNLAKELANDALLEHETFANHFKHVCKQLLDDLETIERLFT